MLILIRYRLFFSSMPQAAVVEVIASLTAYHTKLGRAFGLMYRINSFFFLCYEILINIKLK